MTTQLILVSLSLLAMFVILTVAHNHAAQTDQDLAYRLIRDVMMIIYIGGLIYFTFIWGNREGLHNIDLKFNFYLIKSFVNFKYDPGTHASLMNLMLFVPMGFMLPQFTKLKLNWPKTILTGLAISLLIETMQLALHRGAFQLDDLLVNTLGTLVGYGLFCVSRVISSNEGISTTQE